MRTLDMGPLVLLGADVMCAVWAQLLDRRDHASMRLLADIEHRPAQRERISRRILQTVAEAAATVSSGLEVLRRQLARLVDDIVTILHERQPALAASS